MKKISILGLCLAAAMTASAQADLLKETEKSFKGVKEYPAYEAKVKEMQPLFSNPETMSLAQTYYIPGKAAFEVYDNLYLQKSIGQNPDMNQMGKALLEGYDYMMKALPLDPVTDAKGKVKTKYTKDIVNTVTGHYNDFNNAGAFLWEVKDFDGAYQAWDIYCSMPFNETLGKSAPKAPVDSVIGQTRYNQALAAWQADKLENAIYAFNKALEIGYVTPELLDYATRVAYQAKDNASLLNYAKKGMELYGSSNPNFIIFALNSYIENNDLASARTLLDESIAKDPNNAVFYFSKGVIEETEKNVDKATENYRKAIELNPEYAQAYLNLGRVITEQYDALDQATANMSQAEYNKYSAETLIPMLHEAAADFEKAYSLDSENMTDALRYLKNIYYVLKDADNLKRVDDLLQ